MNVLIANAWNEYHSFQQHDFVVRPSIPILFFGDSNQYMQSGLKVITVGLNPSKSEFPGFDKPDPDPFMRFEDARNVYPAILNGQNYSAYIDALNNYFRNKPYNWFRCFEPILQGLECSYYGKPTNAALHTDLCSPLATTPTWSRLSNDAREKLKGSGVTLWHKLMESLAPDVVILSVARQHLSKIMFDVVEPWTPFFKTLQTKDGRARKKPYVVEIQRVQLTATKTAILVFGEAANTPFGTVSNPDKARIGAAVGRRLHGG